MMGWTPLLLAMVAMALPVGGPLMPCGTSGDQMQDQRQVGDAFEFVKGVCEQQGESFLPGAALPASCGSTECRQAVQLADDSCGPAFAKDAFLKTAFKPILDAAVAVCASAPPRDSRCIAGVAKMYKVKKGDSCASISAAQHVPQFDILGFMSLSCCEGDTIADHMMIQLCDVPSAATWHARGLPREKIVMTYLGGIGYINKQEYPAPHKLPDSVNIAALAFAEDVDGRGHFEMGVQAGCTQPDCKTRSGTGFNADCAAQVDPSIVRSHDNERRWLVSIVPRDANQWPYVVEPDEWGANAAASLKEIILRYRLDGIDVDFEDPHADPRVFTTAMCSLFKNLKEQLPGAIVSTAFYGNPSANQRQQQTIPLYKDLKAQCDDLIDVYNYQNYANWVDDTNANVRNIKLMGEQFGWHKFVWGVGVGGQVHSTTWRWWPSRPGVNGPAIMQQLLADEKGKHMRGVFTWAGEFSEGFCEPKWCIEDQFKQQLDAPDNALPPTPCACRNQG